MQGTPATKKKGSGFALGHASRLLTILRLMYASGIGDYRLALQRWWRTNRSRNKPRLRGRRCDSLFPGTGDSQSLQILSSCFCRDPKSSIVAAAVIKDCVRKCSIMQSVILAVPGVRCHGVMQARLG